ncbi:hypothetical protein O7626_40810 [Micromonospora sp. WMMD1102]|uniref:hypothetical protein n=1 Tax=Micromonospora sp. WMMD1102 TaxID=3016105 RepID=UPI0024156B12|nr:hypothetical protein [Micromonospora sp. WMMD1102]MDG4790343.1 hypothetical protein [Micromonospora sp. WMMD1102]MDG4792146.1 hypothetical protein [Micromonospora sp. WMMD1102]
MTNLVPASPDPRAELVAGLRALADFFEANPDMPIPSSPKFEHIVLTDNDRDGLAEMAQIGRLLDVAPITSASLHTNVNTRFRGLAYRAFYVARDRMAQHREEQSYVDNVRAARPSVLDGEVVTPTRALPARSSSANSVALLGVTR